MSDIEAIRDRDAFYVSMGWDFDAEPLTGRQQMAQDRHLLLAQLDRCAAALAVYAEAHRTLHRRGITDCPICADIRANDLSAATTA